MEIKIKKKRIGEKEPVFIIGEMAWSHDGSIDNAKKIIKAVHQAGGDAISMHLTSISHYMTKYYMSKNGKATSGEKNQKNIYNYLDEINLSKYEWKELFLYARDLGLITCLQCNDLYSLKISKEMQPDIYVIPAACFIEEKLVKKTAKMMKPIILRTGGSTLGEIEKAIGTIKEFKNDKIMILHGIQTYPTKIEDTNLRLIETFSRLFSLPVGMADHIDAQSDFSLIIPLLSVALGAKLIEKHITYDRSKKGEDFESALNPDEFKKLVKNIHLTEKALGNYFIKPHTSSELEYRKVSRKKTVAKYNINKGEIIKEGMITYKRADEGISPDRSKYIIGRSAKCNIKKDEGITTDKLV